MLTYSILPVAGLRLGLFVAGPCSACLLNGVVTVFPRRVGKRFASSRILARLPKMAVSLSSGTSKSPKRIRSPIHKCIFLTRIQQSFRFTKVPLLDPASLMETSPSSASSIRACKRDSAGSSRTRSHDGSRPHVFISACLFTQAHFHCQPIHNPVCKTAPKDLLQAGNQPGSIMHSDQ